MQESSHPYSATFDKGKAEIAYRCLAHLDRLETSELKYDGNPS